jgi:hypothetical protein
MPCSAASCSADTTDTDIFSLSLCV